MAFTLADAKKLSDSKLTKYVIDEFRKSPLLDVMVFDDTVKPQGGSSLSYVYNRVTTLPTAAGRAINSEYVSQEAKTDRITVDLKVFGGSFEIDRVLQNSETEVVNHVNFQLEQKIKATRALFADWFINGDSAVDETAFEGLDKSLTGSSTEKTLDTALDLSSAEMVEKNWKAFTYYLRQVMKLMDGAPTIMGVNSDMFAIFQSIADLSTQYTQTKNELGTEIVKWGTATIMDLGYKPGTSKTIIETSSDDGTTDIYFARIGLDGVHGVTPTGSKEPSIYLPELKTPGAVKKGEVEMVAATAIKASRAAAVLRKVKVV